ncbi:MAG: hypothetical protein ACLP05_00060 [Candidatus Kryptoniota bacterium]
MRHMKSGMDPKTIKEIDELIDIFLDEFMSEEYKGGQHIVAREHYSKVFHEILPKYLRRCAILICESTSLSETQEV